MPRQEKKSRIVGLPPRIFLQTKDSETGSMPTMKRRIASDNRNGLISSSFDDTNSMVFTTSLNSGFIYGQNILNSFATKTAYSSSYGKGFFEISGGVAPTNHYITASVIEYGSTTKGVSDTFVSPIVAGQEPEPFRDFENPAVDGKSQQNPFYATGSDVATYGEGLDQPVWSKTKIEIDLSPSRTHGFGIQNYLSTSQNHPMAYWNKSAKVYEGIGPGIEFDVYKRPPDTTPYPGTTCLDEQTIGFAGSIDTLVNAEARGESLRNFGTVISNYGFPFHPKFHATSSNLIPMSDYIDQPFLAEKIVLEFSGSLISMSNVHTGSYMSAERTPHIDTVRTSLSTFFILNQTNISFVNEAQKMREIGYGGDEVLQQAYYATASSPGTYVISGSDSPLYGGATPPLRGFSNTSRELITYVQIANYSSSVITGSQREWIDREYTIDNYPITGWQGRCVISGVCKVPTGGTTPNIFAESVDVLNNSGIGFIVYNLSGEAVEWDAFVETNVKGARVGLGNFSGRSLLNSTSNYRIKNLDLSGSANILVMEEYFKENPYFLMPKDNLVVGWQVPMSSICMNLLWESDSGGVTLAYSGSGPRLEFPAAPARLVIYGSTLKQGREEHDTLNQFLTSEVINEDIE